MNASEKPPTPPSDQDTLAAARSTAPEADATMTLAAGGARAGAFALSAWGSLELRERVGAGGFAEVFRAWDPTLQREVALKLLLQPALESGSIDQSLAAEARLLARFRHPNVVTVYGLAQHHGRIGLWMEFLRGPTLFQLVKLQGRFSSREAAMMGIDVCRAVAAVHAAGLVHRDIKAQNVIREEGGRVVLTDFGLGQLTSVDTATMVASLAGTPSYMAPELFEGQSASVRSDLYAIGVLLYYLVSGTVPVEGGTMNEMVAAHRKGSRKLLTDVRPDLPEGFLQIVTRATAARPDQRHETAGQLATALSQWLQESTEHSGSSSQPVQPQTPGAAPLSQRRNWMLALTATTLGIAGSLAYWGGWRGFQPSRFDQANLIAVLPFENASGNPDDEYLADGIAEELTNTLTASPQLRVAARASAFRFKGKQTDLKEVGQKLQVSTVLTGHLRRRGEIARISVQMVDVQTGFQIWSETYERPVRAVPGLEREIGASVAATLKVPLDARSGPAGASGQQSGDAQHFYLQGLYQLRKGSDPSLQKAIEYFSQSITADPRAARTWAAMAEARTLRAFQGVPSKEEVARIKEEAGRALALDDRLAEPHAVLGYSTLLFDWDWQGADAHFRRAIQRNPRDVDTRLKYSGLLMNMARLKESRQQIEAVLAMDPGSPMANHFLSGQLLLENRLAEAEKTLLKVLEVDPERPMAHQLLGIVYARMGRMPQAVANFRDAVRTSANNGMQVAQLAWGLGQAGQEQEARELLAGLLEREKQGGVAKQEIAVVYAGLRDRDQAFAWLEKAYAAHESNLVQIKVRPVWDPIRTDARYKQMVERVGLNPN